MSIVYLTDYGTGTAFYVDATDIVQEGTWLSSFTGTEVPYLNWYTTEPNGGTGENCLALYNYGPVFIDIGCERGIFGLCEYECKISFFVLYFSRFVVL